MKKAGIFGEFKGVSICQETKHEKSSETLGTIRSNYLAIVAAIYRSARVRARPRKCPKECFLGVFGHLARSGTWELVDPVVADPVAQVNDKRNNAQIYTEIPSCCFHKERGPNFYLVELGLRQLGLQVAAKKIAKRSLRFSPGGLRLESQRPATGLRTPKSPKVPGRVLGRVPKKRGLLGGLLGAVPFLCFSTETGLPALLPAVPPAVPFFPALFPALSPALFGIWAFSVL